MASSEGTEAAQSPAAPRTIASSASQADKGQPETRGAPTEGTSRGAQEGLGTPSGPVAPATPLDAARISCLTNAHYHASREAFLDTVHRWFMFGVIIFGAAAVADLLPKNLYGIELPLLKSMLAAGAAVLGALDLTFDLCNRARAHSMMKRRYFELLADLHEKRKPHEEVTACLERYSADEEPPYRVLLFASWNAAQKAVYGNRALAFNIPKWSLAFKNVCRRPTVSYPVIGGA